VKNLKQIDLKFGFKMLLSEGTSESRRGIWSMMLTNG